MLASAAVLAALPAHANTGSSPDVLLAHLRAPVLETGSAVEVEGVELPLGPARFAIERGVVVPATIARGRPIELVFVGRARFRFVPPDAVEEGQLELFTGERRLDVPIEEAVLAAADLAKLEPLLGAPVGVRGEAAALERAAALHAWWLRSAERRHTAVVSGLFRGLAGDAAHREYVALWCASSEIGPFLFRQDPAEREQVTLASYDAPDLSYRERLA